MCDTRSKHIEAANGIKNVKKKVVQAETALGGLVKRSGNIGQPCKTLDLSKSHYFFVSAGNSKKKETRQIFVPVHVKFLLQLKSAAL